MRVGLFDGSFRHQVSVSLGGECNREAPKYIKWARDEICPNTVFTDMHIRNFSDQERAYRKFAWIIEPDWLLNGDNPDVVMSKFDRIFTSNLDFAAKYPRQFIYTPLGGSWIPENEWGMFGKSKLFSMMTTDKYKAPGHKIRHELAFDIQAQELPVDMYGRGSKPIDSKIKALRPYYYSIVVEGYQIPGYFTEKLIDCLSQGTIPIYLGDPRIDLRFASNHFMVHSDMEGILYWISTFPESFWIDNYNKNIEGIKLNMELARRYRCAEDRLFEDHPYAFSF